MISRITVADAREALYPYVCGDDRNSSRFLEYLNQARERILNSGKWKGTVLNVLFEQLDGYISLPREGEALLGLHVNNFIFPVNSKWYEFNVGGPGKIPESVDSMGSAIDLGENYCTIENLDSAVEIVLEATNAEDTGQVIRLFGKDANGEEIFDADGVRGEAIELSTSPVPSTKIYSTLTQVNKGLTTGYVKLYANETPDRLLANYAPSELNPLYRRYMLKTKDDASITGKMKLRYFPLCSESEPVVPANLGALKMALLALTYEDSNDMASAQNYWGNCYSLLDDQMREHRGNARMLPNISLFPSGRGIPSIM
jgi:hypothetical protein